MRAALVPGALALLPQYAGLEDPVADLRAACRSAVAWLGPDVVVLGTAQGRRVGAHLVAEAGLVTASTEDGGNNAAAYLVVANGSAKRSTTSPGYLDERAAGFDADLGARLRSGDVGGVDHDLARELWADTTALDELAAVLPAGCPGTVDLEQDPYGVQYWVVRWQW